MTNGSSIFESITFVSPLPMQGSNLPQRKGKTSILSPSTHWILNSHRIFLCLYSPGLQPRGGGTVLYRVLSEILVSVQVAHRSCPL